MITRILIAICASPLLVLAACEDSGGPVDRKADQAGEMAEELTEQRLEEAGYGPLDQQYYGEIEEERYELMVDTQEINNERAAAEEDDGILGKP